MMSDRAVELHVVEVQGLGLRLERVGGVLVLERLVLGLPEASVLVDRDLAVERDDLAVLGQHQRVDLDERGVLLAVHGPQLLDRVGDGAGEFGGEARGRDDLGGLGGVDADDRVDGHARKRLGPLDRELLDLHAALDRAHREVAALGAIEQHGEVELLRDLGSRGDHHLVDRVALDVHAQDLRWRRPRRRRDCAPP